MHCWFRSRVTVQLGRNTAHVGTRGSLRVPSSREFAAGSACSSLQAAAYMQMAMEWMMQYCRWCVFLMVFGVVGVTVVRHGAAAAAAAASPEEVLVERLVEPERLHQQHVPCDDDPFSLLCGEENGSYRGSSVEAYLKTLLKDGPRVEKEPLCTVNCFRADPICGSDGVTYWCGVAEAMCAQVEIAHEGYCDIGNGDVGANLALHALQSLQLVHMLWLVLAGFLIIIGLP